MLLVVYTMKQGPTTEKRLTEFNRVANNAMQQKHKPAILKGADYTVWNTLMPSFPSGRAHNMHEFGYVEYTVPGNAKFTVTFFVECFTPSNTMNTFPAIAYDPMLDNGTFYFNATARVSVSGPFEGSDDSRDGVPMFMSSTFGQIAMAYHFSVSGKTPFAPATIVTPISTTITVAPRQVSIVDMQRFNILKVAAAACAADPHALQSVDMSRPVYGVVRAGQVPFGPTPPDGVNSMAMPHGHINLSVLDALNAIRVRTKDINKNKMAFMDLTTAAPGDHIFDKDAYTEQMKPYLVRLQTETDYSAGKGSDMRGVTYRDLALYAALAKDDGFCASKTMAALTPSATDLIVTPWVPLAWRVGDSPSSTSGWENAPKQAYAPISVPSDPGSVCTSQYTSDGNFYSQPNTNGLPKLLYQGYSPNNTIPMYMFHGNGDEDITPWFSSDHAVFGWANGNWAGRSWDPVTYTFQSTHFN